MEKNFSKDLPKRNLAIAAVGIMLLFTICIIFSVRTIPSNSATDRLATYRQCYDEMALQAWGLNFLYCKDLETPVIRTVSSKNWDLINNAGILTFTTSETDYLKISPCCEGLHSFAYLLADDYITEFPPKDGWISVPSSDGTYRVPFDKVEKSLILKYKVKNEILYGVINKVKTDM